MTIMLRQLPVVPRPARRARIAPAAMRLLRLTAAVAMILIAAGRGSELHAQSIVAIVNGEAITNSDIEQRIKLNTLTKHTKMNRQEALQDLIDDKVKIKEGKKFGLDLSASDIDESFNNTASRMRMNAEQLTKVLENNGIRADSFKARMKADMTWSNLVRGRFGKSFDVSDADLRAKLGGTPEANQTESFEYIMRPIVLVVPRDAPQSLRETRRKEAEQLRARVESCDQAASIFRTMGDAAIRDSVTKLSADLAPPLREMLDKTPIGKLTPPEVTRQGIEMVALCDRKPTKVDSPAKRQLKEKMYSERFEAKSKSYLAEARKGAMIEMR